MDAGALDSRLFLFGVIFGDDWFQNGDFQAVAVPVSYSWYFTQALLILR
jgi:hypothetical protein